MVINALKRLIRWAVTATIVDESNAFPTQIVGYFDKYGDSLLWFPYGFHASPGVGELNLIIGIGGNSDDRVNMPGSPRQRPRDLVSGEVVVYHPKTGSRVHFKDNGDVEVTSITKILATAPNVEIVASVKVLLTTPEVQMTGNLDVDGDLNVDGNVELVGTTTIEGFDFTGHTHGGVETGSGTTGDVNG